MDDNNPFKINTKCAGNHRKMLRYDICKRLLPSIYAQLDNATFSYGSNIDHIIDKTIEIADKLIDKIENISN